LPEPLPRAQALPDSPLRRVAAAIVESTKPRITRLVSITTAVGFGVPALARSWQPSELATTAAATLLGTFLSASGANALNQWWERDRDALMRRTCARPLPTNRATPATIFAAGSILALTGVLLLAAACGPAPALVSLATILLYVLIYTPLKPVTPFALHIGAIPGALPPVIGWTAALGGALDSIIAPCAWLLFAIMLVWQLPHFLAIAWMYREDYARGGYKVLPVLDPEGRRTAAAVLRWSILLLAITIAPPILTPNYIGTLYLIAAALSGLAFVALCLRLSRTRSRQHARAVFFASIIHLPLILIAMTTDAAINSLL